MPAEEFRAMAARVVDWITEYRKNIEARRVLPQVRPGDIRARLPGQPPETGEPMERILEDFDRIIAPGLTHWNHPGFFAYFPAGSSGPGVLGEMLAASLNVNGMLWKTSPAASELEQVSLDWLRQLLGLPSEFWGMTHEGASASTFHAMAAAREQAAGPEFRRIGFAALEGEGRGPLCLYATEQTHSSIDKAAIALGLGLEAIRRVPVDDVYRMDPRALAAAVAEDRRDGRRPFCVVATVGTTAPTSIDPVAAIATICEQEGLWLHVDAAYGGSVAVVEEQRGLVAGWERADSITVNPHKWLGVPIECSALYTRRADVLRRAFSLVPEYLRTERTGEIVDYMDYGLTLGRRFRALKLWFVLRYFGRQRLAARIREHLRLAQWFAAQIDAHPGFERVAPVPLSTICFRARTGPAGDGAHGDGEASDRLNERLMQAVNDSGQVYLSHARLRDRLVLRLAISGLGVEERHVRLAWELLQAKLHECIRSA
jgi:aromatic-L-amino-acid decarboxylase